MIDVEVKVRIYEIDGAETPAFGCPVVVVKSHSIYDSKVILKVGDKNYTVIAKDLRAAIDNAVNTVRF